MNVRQKLLASTTALGLAAAGIAYFSTSEPSGGGQRAARVLAKGCDVTITSPEADVTGTARISAGQSRDVTLQGKALRCPAGTVSVYASVGGGAESLLGTATVSAAGAWSYGPTTVTDNATTVLRAAMSVVVDDASRPTEARLTVDTATARPRVVLTTPAPNGNGRAYIAAPAADGGCGGGGNLHADKGEPGYYYDQGCAAGGQVNPVVAVYGGCQGHGDASYDAGCDPGTLTATYGVTPLAEVEITQDPQTFTSAELGQWTLDDWTRDDLVVRAAAGGGARGGGPGDVGPLAAVVGRAAAGGAAGAAETVVDLQVATESPPVISYEVTVLNRRSADFDVSFALPTTPAPVARPTIELYWTTSTRRKDGLTSSVSGGNVTVTTSPTEVGTAHTALRSGVFVVPNIDGGYAGIFCAASTSPDAGAWLTKGSGGAVSPCGSIGDAGGWSDDPYNHCCETGTAPVYCRTTSGTASVAVSEIGFCSVVGSGWLNSYLTSGGYRYPAADHVAACWGDGTETGDAGTEVQLWRCKDGKQYRGGETYVEHVIHAPPLDVYYFYLQVVW